MLPEISLRATSGVGRWAIPSTRLALPVPRVARPTAVPRWNPSSVRRYAIGSRTVPVGQPYHRGHRGGHRSETSIVIHPETGRNPAGREPSVAPDQPGYRRRLRRHRQWIPDHEAAQRRSRRSHLAAHRAVLGVDRVDGMAPRPSPLVNDGDEATTGPPRLRAQQPHRAGACRTRRGGHSSLSRPHLNLPRIFMTAELHSLPPIGSTRVTSDDGCDDHLAAATCPTTRGATGLLCSPSENDAVHVGHTPQQERPQEEP